MIAGGLKARFSQVLGKAPTKIHYIGGGSINQAARVEVGKETYFVKWKYNAPSLFFEREGRGLHLLREVGAIRVPEVIHQEEAAPDHPAYLILEWIEESPRAEPLTFAVTFGRALAELHRIESPDALFGLDHDNFIGELPQSNKANPSWITFYRERRLLPQIEIARTRKRLPLARQRLLRGVVDTLEDSLQGAATTPALIHGDLWGGNFLVTAGNQPVLVDPAVYYADREIEIAFTELFGGFPPGFLAAYREAFPLTGGYERRRLVYQLYPLLVHLNLFGERYGAQIDTLCGRLMG